MTPITLVVEGTCKIITETKGGDFDFEIQVKKVLYGSIAGSTVQFRHPWRVEEGKPLIFALAPSPYNSGFDLKYTLGTEEEKSQTALSAARLDFTALSANNIFIGKELDADDNYLSRVKVVRSISGARLEPGSKVTVQMDGYMRGGDHPYVRSEPMIYFVDAVRTGRDIYDMPRGRDKETVFHAETRLRADQEPAVKGALERRKAYPVTEVTENNAKMRVREILFRGTHSEAIEMMASSSDAAVTLAVRRLIADKETARQEVVTAIEKDLLKQQSEGTNPFRRLYKLIQLLPSLEENQGDVETLRLVDRLITYIADKPTVPPPPAGPTKYWQREEDRTDVNHSLAWLLETIKPEELNGALAERIIKLRDGIDGDWRREVQLAMDAAAIEETRDLSEALSRGKNAKPVQIEPSFKVMGESPVFSHDGKLLAAGSKIWNVADWSEAASFADVGSVAAMFFSPDDRFLYLLGGGTTPVNFRLDWRTGKREDICTEHTGYITSATVSSDGSRMITLSFFDFSYSLQIWELPSGKQLRKMDLPRGYSYATINPSGTLLLRQTGETELTVEPLAGGKSKKIKVSDGWYAMAFTPDGAKLIVLTRGWNEAKILTYDVAKGFNLAGVQTLDTDQWSRLVISPDSQNLVVMDQYGRAEALSLADLKTKKSLLDRKTSEGSVTFSPDGSLLAIGSSYEPVRLFDGRTFDPILPATGHAGGVAEIHFSKDGALLRSIGGDNTVCSWDARSGKMQSRILLPPGYQVISSRQDGKYLVCYESNAWENSAVNGDENQTNHAKIVDSDTGKICCEPILPMGRFRTKIHWIDDHQAIVADWTHICIFDYLSGQIVKDTAIDNTELGNGMGELTEDGKSIVVVDGGGKQSFVEVQSIDVQTGKATLIGKHELTIPFSGNEMGQVPGGKYLFVGDPGHYVLDRASLKPVAQKDVRGLDLLRIAFRPKGDRYAAVTGGRIFIDENLRQHDPGTQSVIRVQETLTGKEVWAVISPSRWIRDMVFDPTGTRLACVDHDGLRITLWDIPD